MVKESVLFLGRRRARFIFEEVYGINKLKEIVVWGEASEKWINNKFAIKEWFGRYKRLEKFLMMCMDN